MLLKIAPNYPKEQMKEKKNVALETKFLYIFLILSFLKRNNQTIMLRGEKQMTYFCHTLFGSGYGKMKFDSPFT